MIDFLISIKPALIGAGYAIGAALGWKLHSVLFDKK